MVWILRDSLLFHVYLRILLEVFSDRQHEPLYKIDQKSSREHEDQKGDQVTDIGGKRIADPCYDALSSAK